MRRSLPFLAVAAAILGCAAPGEPLRAVLVLQGGVDPDVDQRLAEALADELGEFGFRPVVDPVVLDATADGPAAARKRARTATAAHAVLLRPSAVQEREGVLPGTSLQAVRLEVTVVNEDDGHPLASHAMEFTSEAARPEVVEARVLDAFVAGNVPFLVTALSLTPQVAAVQPSDVEVEDLAGLQRLRELDVVIGGSAARAQAREAYCRDEAAALADDGARCFGDPCGQYTMLGVDAQDRAIVEDIGRVPIFDIPDKDRHWWEPPERMLALPLDPPHAPAVLLRSGNFYGFGAFLPGASVGAVELFSAEGTTALHAFDLADGRRRAQTLYAPDEESVFSRAAPGGEFVLACLQDAGCFVDAGAGREPVADFAIAEVVALPGGPRVFGQLRTGELALDGPGDAPAATTRLRGEVEDVLGVHDGLLRLVVSDDDGACSLVTVTPEPFAVAETVPMPICLSDPTSLPDGRLLGTADATSAGDVPGDDEVVTWTPGDADLVAHTKGAAHEEYAYATRDGKRAVFNRRLAPPPREFDVGLYRRVVCVTDL